MCVVMGGVKRRFFCCVLRSKVILNRAVCGCGAVLKKIAVLPRTTYFFRSKTRPYGRSSESRTSATHLRSASSPSVCDRRLRSLLRIAPARAMLLPQKIR